MSLRKNIFALSSAFLIGAILSNDVSTVDDVLAAEVGASWEGVGGVDEDDDEDGGDERRHTEAEREIAVATRVRPTVAFTPSHFI